MEKTLKKPSEFKEGDIIDTCLGHINTIVELVEIQREKWSSVETYVFKVKNNFSDKVYIKRYNSLMPQIVIGNEQHQQIKVEEQDNE